MMRFLFTLSAPAMSTDSAAGAMSWGCQPEKRSSNCAYLMIK